MKLESLFPVQKEVIPVILNQNKTQSIYPNDLCILAPTGSGKTLTYVLPIIESLKTRIRPCCRAIILLPVSDLAEQVYSVFKTYLNDEESTSLINTEEPNKNSNNLKCILLSNKHTFAKEQAQLVNEEHGKCLIDIVITTPGRLVDHIQKTKGFHLNELKYLVLDECDRIMEQIKQNWLPLLNQAIFGNSANEEHPTRDLLNNESINAHNFVINKSKLMPFQKILLSATLTRNPEKLEQMKLFQPIYFSFGAEKLKNSDQKAVIEVKNKVSEEGNTTVDLTPQDSAPEATKEVKVVKEISKRVIESKKFDMDMADVNVPNELKEIFIQVILQQKPLVAIYLIKTLGYGRMLVFVNSKDTAKRLNKLFELNNINSMEYSSALHAARRKRIQTKFEEGKLDVLVCSDVMARGMDLANVDYVLMYDAPKHLSSYIHKAGRTARAGRTGMAITFLEHKEIFFLKKWLNQSDRVVQWGLRIKRRLSTRLRRLKSKKVC